MSQRSPQDSNPMSLPSAHDQWPQFYTIPAEPPHPQASAFTNYLPSSSYTTPWTNTSVSSIPQQKTLPSSSSTTQLHPAYSYEFDRPQSSVSYATTSNYVGSMQANSALEEWDSGPHEVSYETSSIVESDTGSSYPAAEIDADGESSTDSRHTSVPASISTVEDLTASQPFVKMEPDDPDGRFIMELSAFPTPTADHLVSSSKLSPTSTISDAHTKSAFSQSQAPPTEVPLRATQASKEMRRMMGVFRLNPFAMHSLSLGGCEDGEAIAKGKGGNGDVGHGLPIPGAASWCGGEARPLDEEPLIFEFQLDVVGRDSDEGNLTKGEEIPSSLEASSGSLGLGVNEVSQLRPFSPSFQLNRDDEAELKIESFQEDSDDIGDDEHSTTWADAECNDSPETYEAVTVAQPTEIQPGECSRSQSTQSRGFEQRQVHLATSPNVHLPSSSFGWDTVAQHYASLEGDESQQSIHDAAPRVQLAYGGLPQRSPRLHPSMLMLSNPTNRVLTQKIATSHPYLRKNPQQAYQVPASPDRSCAPHPQPHRHHTHASPTLPLLNMSTHHSKPHHLTHFVPPEQNRRSTYHGHYPGDRYGPAECPDEAAHRRPIAIHDHATPAPMPPHSGRLGGDTPMVSRYHPTSYMHPGRGYQDLSRDHGIYGPPRHSNSVNTEGHVSTYTQPLSNVSHLLVPEISAGSDRIRVLDGDCQWRRCKSLRAGLPCPSPRWYCHPREF